MKKRPRPLQHAKDKDAPCISFEILKQIANQEPRFEGVSADGNLEGSPISGASGVSTSANFKRGSTDRKQENLVFP